MNATDKGNHNVLHHAVFGNKPSVVKYLLTLKDLDKTQANNDGLLAIDFCQNSEIEKVLSKFQEGTIDKSKKNNTSILRRFFGRFTGSSNTKSIDLRSFIENDKLIQKGGKRVLKINQGDKHEINLNYFTIMQKLGQGSFASVYLVCPKSMRSLNPDKVPEQLYAMKVLEKKNIIEQNLARYAATERNVLCVAGRNDFIVGLDFAFQNNHRLYLIMQYCPGGDLGNEIKKHGRFDEETSRKYICEVICALEFLHKNNIVFRDLKPENIVLDMKGHAKLTDFGLSKDHVDSETRNNSFVGSVAYMAPEILNRKGHTKSVDWYLVGVLLYEMIVGIPPYYDDDED